MVLERRGDQKDGIDRHPGKGQALRAAILSDLDHFVSIDDTPSPHVRQRLSSVCPSAADDQFEPRGDAAQVAFTQLRGEASRTEDSLHA